MSQYEIDREQQMLRNQQMLDKLSIVRQLTICEAFRACKKTATKPVKPRTYRPHVGPVQPAMKRRSRRLLGEAASTSYTEVDEDGEPEHQEDGLVDLVDRCRSGSLAETSGADTDAAGRPMAARCCAPESRGGPYDSLVGLTCHFCRQKRLCAEPACPRCRRRDTSAECTGKSSCSRCQSATGVHCSGCLLVRYGHKLEDVREQMAAGTWLCPHCYEEEHPHEGWFCNSSFCMRKRGNKATGIAIYVAQAAGFPSVAHYLQGQMRKKQQAAGPSTEAAVTAAEQSEAGAAADTSAAKLPAAVLNPEEGVALTAANVVLDDAEAVADVPLMQRRSARVRKSAKA